MSSVRLGKHFQVTAMTHPFRGAIGRVVAFDATSVTLDLAHHPEAAMRLQDGRRARFAPFELMTNSETDALDLEVARQTMGETRGALAELLADVDAELATYTGGSPVALLRRMLPTIAQAVVPSIAEPFRNLFAVAISTIVELLPPEE